MGEGGAELREREGNQAFRVGGGEPGVLERFVGLVVVGLVELGEAENEVGVGREIGAVA